MQAGIYTMRNTTNGRQYIGGSVDLSMRKARHFSALKNGNHYSREMQQDYNKEHAFEFEVIIPIDITEGLTHWQQKELRLQEQYYLNTIPNTYNLRHTRMEPLNEVGSLAWVNEMRGIIDMVRPVDAMEGQAKG